MTERMRPVVFVEDWDRKPAGVTAGFTTRSGGYSRGPFAAADGQGGLNLGDHVGDAAGDVEQNRLAFFQQIHSDVIFLSQVHGILVADASELKRDTKADAVISDQPGKVCAVLTADCLPVLFSDVAGNVVGAAHAGWRGLAGGVLEATASAMRVKGASELIAWMGPAIGPACFEVGQDVVQVFTESDSEAHSCFVKMQNGKEGKYLADIYALAKRKLNACGIEQISGGGMCTVTDTQNFYSYRRDQQTGRMASFIYRQPQS